MQIIKKIEKILWKILYYIFGRTRIYRKIGILSEIYFWNEYTKQHLEEVINPQRWKERFPVSLLPYIEDMQKKRRSIAILDLGSGPFSPLVWGVQQQLFTLVAVDPLADKYNALLNKYKIFYPIRLIKGAAEDLLCLFSMDSFDIVYSRNALDHVRDVKRCVENIYLALRQDGIFFLEGFIKEGTRTNWAGLHQYDLLPINGELICYDKKGQSINVTSSFVCIYQEQTGVSVGDGYKIIFRK